MASSGLVTVPPSAFLSISSPSLELIILTTSNTLFPPAPAISPAPRAVSPIKYPVSFCFVLIASSLVLAVLA